MYILLLGLVSSVGWAQQSGEEDVPEASAPSEPNPDWALPLVGWTPANPFAEEEAPPSLFNLDRGDAEVDLYLLGFWNVSSTLATGISVHPPLPGSGDRVTYPYIYPGFETNLFDQTVDLTLSLWLYQRYFFEASFADESTLNTIAAGYYAADDELVQELVVGNVPLAVQRYPYQYAGSPNARAGNRPTPGAVVRLSTARTYHEFLLQLENSVARRERYAAGATVQEARIRPERYLRGRVFVLPDEDVRSVEVLIEDSDGSVLATGGTRRFRSVSPEAGEYVIDEARGILQVSDQLAGETTLAVWYESTGGEVGTVGGGLEAIVPLDGDLTPTDGTLLPFDFTVGDLYPGISGSAAADATGADYRLQLADGRDALILREPGRFSPFEAASFYEAPDGAAGVLDEATTRIRIVRAAGRIPVDQAYTIETFPEEGLIRVGADSNPRSRDWRYPFAGRDYASATMYGPRASSEITSGDVEILVEFRAGATGIPIDSDIVPGTLQVTVNGVPLEGVEYEGGELVLPESVDPNATIDVSYRVYQQGGNAGDLIFVNGNRWSITDSLLLTLATGVRWTLAQNSYSEELDQHPGTVTVSSGLEYETDNLSIESALAVQVSQPDTTGFMRLFGAGENTWSLTPNAENLFPAGLPSDGSVTETDRVVPYYRDYWTADVLGNVGLLPYSQSAATEGSFGGERMGPYLARSTDDGYTGSVAVLDWESLAPSEWTGATLRSSADPVDLRDAASLTVSFRYLADDPSDTAGTPELLLQLGTIDEDLDGDGVLDRGSSAVDPGLRFDLADGSFRRAGQYSPALSSPHSEDGNDDDVLGVELQNAIWSDTVASASLRQEGWQEVRFDIDSSDAELLSAVRGGRLIIRNTDGTETIGAARLLIGSVKITRTGSAAIIATGGGSPRVSLTGDPLTGAQSLETRFDVVGERFNPDEDDQEVLRLAWTGAGTDAAPGPDGETEVAAETTIPDLSLDRYRTLTVYAYLADPDPIPATPAEVVFALSPYRRATASALSWRVDADLLTGEWHEISLDLDSGDISVDDAVVGTTTIPDDATTLLRLFTVGTTGIDAGTLYIDELHARDPRATAAFAGRLSVDWGVDIGPGRLSVQQDLAAQTQGFRSAETGASAAESDGAINRSLYSRSRAEYGAGAFRIAGETSARVTGLGETGAFAHELDLPVVSGILSLEERFRRDYDYLDPFVDRSFAVAAGAEGLGTYRIETANRVDALETEQEWQLNAVPPLPESMSLSLSAGLIARDLDTVVETDDYGTDWIASWNRFIKVVDDGRSERRGTGAIGLGYREFLVDFDGSWRNESDTTGLQNSAIAWGAEITTEMNASGRRPWRFTPRYSRDFSVDERRESGDFGRDLSIWTSAVGNEPIVFTAVPVLELFQDGDALNLDAPDGAVVRRNYRSEGRLQFSRVLGSRVRDLFVPSDVELVLDRNRSWEGASLNDARTWQGTISAIAINLFGIDGSRPLTERYRSDEFRTSLILSLDEQVGAEPLGHRVAVESEITLFGLNEAELGLDNRFEQARTAVQGDRTAEFTSELEYSWIRPGYPKIAVFERMETAPFYRHTESIGYEAGFSEGDLDRSELLLGHDSSLIVGENGTISIFGEIGWLIDPGAYENGSLQAFGLLVGIEGELRY